MYAHMYCVCVCTNHLAHSYSRQVVCPPAPGLHTDPAFYHFDGKKRNHQSKGLIWGYLYFSHQSCCLLSQASNVASPLIFLPEEDEWAREAEKKVLKFSVELKQGHFRISLGDLV